jgi:hypothetical protein
LWQETRLGYITEILSPKWSPCSGFSSDEEVKEAVTTCFEEQSKDFFFQGDKVVATKVYWVIRGLHWKIKKYFFVISCFFFTQVDKLLNAPRTLLLVQNAYGNGALNRSNVLGGIFDFDMEGSW